MKPFTIFLTVFLVVPASWIVVMLLLAATATDPQESGAIITVGGLFTIPVAILGLVAGAICGAVVALILKHSNPEA